MNAKDFTEMVEVLNNDRLGLMRKKSHDYATSDVLSNFKRTSSLCATLQLDLARSPVDCALYYILIKLDRLCNLHNSGNAPLNESMLDTIIDMHNYIDLLAGLLKEASDNAK